MPVGECYAPGSLAQKKSREEPEERNASTDEADTEKEAALPTCTAGQKPRTDLCIAAKVKYCPKNVLPKVIAGEEIDCVIKPLCSENPGMAVGECYAPGALVQKRSREGPDVATEGDSGEAIAPLPACTGAAGEAAGVDCKKVK